MFDGNHRLSLLYSVVFASCAPARYIFTRRDGRVVERKVRNF